MIKNRDIIIFGDDWGRYPSTIQHIGRIFARDNRIIWVGSLGLRRPSVSLSDAKRVFEKLFNVVKGSKNQEEEDLRVYPIHPFIIPFHNMWMFRKFNSYLVRRKIRKKSSELNFTSQIILAASPVVAEIISKLDKSSAHYVCLDDYAYFKDAFKCIPDLEKELLNTVDSCFAVSDDLVENRKPRRGKSYFLPQGVDSEHFNRFRTKDDAEPTHKITIGYFGLIADPWVDRKLLSAAAKAYPEYEFILIGKNEMDLSVFSGIENINYIGQVPYDDLPKYAGRFTVGLIPFQINNLTLACNPLKLREYLSMGIPVVSTDLPEVRKYSEYVFIGRTQDEFIHHIAAAVADCIPERSTQRKKSVENLSWYSIADTISKVVEDIELRKK